MRIHITYTGGTIGMVESPNGLVPGADMRGWLRRLIEDAHLDPSLFSFFGQAHGLISLISRKSVF